jgi:hypothetical protein
MRIKNKNKGQMRVLEAILASFIIIVALSFVNFFAVNPSSQKYEANDLEKSAYNALHDLDLQGLLARFVYDEEWENLTAALSVVLPSDSYFNLTVKDLNDSTINDVPISYGDYSIFENSKAVSSVTYALVDFPSKITPFGFDSKYQPRLLSLQLVRGSQ